MCAYLLEFECSQGKAVKTSQPDNALLISHPLPGFHTEGGGGEGEILLNYFFNTVTMYVMADIATISNTWF